MYLLSYNLFSSLFLHLKSQSTKSHKAGHIFLPAFLFSAVGETHPLYFSTSSGKTLPCNNKGQSNETYFNPLSTFLINKYFFSAFLYNSSAS